MRAAIRSATPGIAWNLVLWWVRFYTLGLVGASRDRRREQIHSDLWEHFADRTEQGASPALIGLEALGRAARGVAADIFWRFGLEGEPKMVSKSVAVRASGVALLVIVGSAIGMMVADFGIGTGEYFRDDFPKFARESDSRGVGLAIGGLLSLAAVFAAAALYWTFRPYQPLVAAIGASALVAASLLMVAAVTAGLVLVDIADEWTARGSVVNDGVWASAHHVAKMHESFGFLSILLLMGSVVVFGALVIWKGAVPRWVGGIGALGGLLLVVAFVGALFSESVFWWTLVASIVLGGVWLLVTGAWLALKGVYEPDARADAV